MSERIDLHLHTSGLDAEFQRSVTLKLEQIFTLLTNIGQKETELMATVLSVQQLIKDLDAETNAAAAKVEAQNARIAELLIQIQNGDPVTQDDLDAISAALTPISERLRALGADPTTPIPTPAPDPLPTE